MGAVDSIPGLGSMIDTAKVWGLRAGIAFVICVFVLQVCLGFMRNAAANERGRLVLITGPQGAGKSTFAALLARRYSSERPGSRDRQRAWPRRIVTNAALCDDWDFIESWYELQSTLISGNCVVLLDEGHLWMPSGRRLSEDRMMTVTQVRKRRSDMIVTSQDPMQVLKGWRKLVNEVWECHPVIPGRVHVARRMNGSRVLERRFYRPRRADIDTFAPAVPPEEWMDDPKKARANGSAIALVEAARSHTRGASAGGRSRRTRSV